MNALNKNQIRVLLILLGGVFVSYLLIGLKPKPESHPLAAAQPHPAEVIRVSLVSDSVLVKSQGTVKPKIEIGLTTQVAGQIVEVSDKFTVGAVFQAGETLLKIDDRDYQIALIQAESALANAKKQLATEKGQALQAKREWKNLNNADANDLFLRKPQLAAAQAAVSAAKAGVAQANLDLERTKISVPFKGVVSKTEVNLGQFVAKGASLAHVFATEVMEVRLPLTSRQAQLLNMKMDSSTLKPLSVVLKTTVGGTEYQWPAKIVRIAPQIDEKSRLIYAIAEVNQTAPSDKQFRPLVPGGFIEAEITSLGYEDIAVLPRSSLYQGDKVLVLDTDHKLHLVKVDILQISEQKLVVRGLRDGDLVLMKSPAFLELGEEYTAKIIDWTDSE